MGKRLQLVLLMLVMSRCGEQVLQPPKDLIPKETMIAVLTELTIINAAKTTNVSIMRENGIVPMSYLFKKYGVDSVQFVTSDKYYASLPVEYEAIHLEVQKRIEKKAEEIVQIKKLNDSLKLAKRKAAQEKAAKKRQGREPAIISVKDSLP